MVIEESGMRFEFPDGRTTVKFDDTPFYRDYFGKLPGSKGVDFITDEKNLIAFVEVKNCLGNENDNRWRIFPNNKKRDTAYTAHDINGRNSLDIEVSQKVAMTLASLCGLCSFGDRKETKDGLDKIAGTILGKHFSRTDKSKLVVLVLEGDFGTHTRSKTIIMSELQRSIAAKMKWLDCKVSVVDSSTYHEKVFRIIH